MDTETVTAALKRPFLARANLTWMGTFNVLWQIGMAFVAAEMLNNDINEAHLLSGLAIATVCISGISFIINCFFWGPTAGTRPNYALVGRCLDETPVTFEKRMARLVRSYGDQWVTSWVLATTSFQLIFMIVFYSRYGIQTFQPLPAVPTPLEHMQYQAVKLFELGQLSIAAITVLITLCTMSDMFKRLILAIYIEGGLQLNAKPATTLETTKPATAQTATGPTTIASASNYTLTGRTVQ